MQRTTEFEDQVILELEKRNLYDYTDYEWLLNNDDEKLEDIYERNDDVNDIVDDITDFLSNETFVCYECNERFLNSEEHIKVNGDYYCEECYNEIFYTCEHCGAVVRRDDTYYVNTLYGEECWCDDCRYDDAFHCYGYDRYYSNEDYDSVEIDGTTYNKIYLENNAYYCENCENWILDSDYWDCDIECCVNCSRSLNGDVRDYHDSPYMVFFGRENRSKKYKHSTQASIGTELEIDCKYENKHNQGSLIEELRDLVDDENNELYFEHDSSLDYGFEIITQPHTYESYMNMNWEEILGACKKYGYTSHDNDTCGLHMHISRDFFGRNEKKQQNAIAKIINFFETNYFEIIKVSRRPKNEECDWARKYYVNNPQSKKEYVDISKKFKKGSWNHSERYKAVNLTNEHTVEFRIMKGTLNANTFRACINFLYRIAMNSKYITWKNVHRIDLWFKGMDKRTLEYISSRGAFTETLALLNVNNNEDNNNTNRGNE